MPRVVWIVVASLAGLSCSRANPAFDQDDASLGTGSLDGPEPVTSKGSSGDPDPSVGGSGEGSTGVEPTAPATSGPTAPGDSSGGTEPVTTGDPPTDGCCDVHDAPHCNDDAVAQCVCEADPFCCDPAGIWDEQCVQGVDAFACGDCGLDTSACCMPSPGPGCGVPTIDQACVCELGVMKGFQTPFDTCCSGPWAPFCVVGAVALCDAACPTLPEGSCCVAGPQVGCNDLDVLSCVCDLDLTCCFEPWSATCAELASGFCLASC